MVHKAIPGVPLVVKAPEYNAAMEAGEWFKGRQLGAPKARDLGGVNPCTVKVRNDSGADCEAGEVLAIGSTVLTAPEKRSLWFAGDVPTSGQNYAVLLDPIADGEIGQAQVVGVCLVSIDIDDEDHDWAHVDSGSTTLVSDFGGTAKILYKPSGTGVKECLVALNVRSSPRKAIADADITAGSSAAVSVYVNGSDLGSVTAWFNWMESGTAEIASGTEVLIEWFDDESKWVVIAAECQA